MSKQSRNKGRKLPALCDFKGNVIKSVSYLPTIYKTLFNRNRICGLKVAYLHPIEISWRMKHHSHG